MKNFVVKVNGNVYNVEVEEATGVTNAPISAKQATAAAPATTPAAPVAAPAGGESVTAPMPGNILDVKVSVGQSVNKGDVLVILEAMKMENEILAPCAGKVVAVSATKGSTVNTGDVLVNIG